MSTAAIPMPLGFSYYQDLLPQEVLHLDIPSNPNYPSHPADDYYDAFVVAMGIGAPEAAWNAVRNGTPMPDFLVEHTPAMPDHERKPGWIYFIPSNWSVEAAVNNAFSAFKWYGVIPVDTEDTNRVWANWDQNDNVTKERHVFSYLPAHAGGPLGYDDDKVNLVMTLYGWATNGDNAGKWIMPEQSGAIVPMLFKRGPDTWVPMFSGARWMEDNAGAMSTVMLAIIGAMVTIVTLGGASAAVIASLVAFQGLLAGVKAIGDNIKSGDMKGLLAGIYKAGSAASDLYANSDTKVKDFTSDLAKSAPSGTAWLNNVSQPFSKLYETTKAYIAQGSSEVDALLKSASTATMGYFPKIDTDYWKNALTNEALGGAKMWALKAQGVAKEQLGDFVNSVPWYAQEAAGLGATIRAVEISQNELPAGQQMHFGSVVPMYNPRNPTMMQIRPELAALIRAQWAEPNAQEAGQATNLKNAMQKPLVIASPTFTPASTTTKNVVIGGLAGATVLYFFRDYIFGRLLDGVFKK